MRTEDGSFHTGENRDGGQYYLHQLVAGSAGIAGTDSAPIRTEKPAARRAGHDVLHAVYTDLLDHLVLDDGHRQDLRRRGLADNQIDRLGYKSLPIRGRTALAARLSDYHDDDVLAVPGIVLRNERITIAGAAGILIPVRDVEGRIAALVVRSDDGPRYTYLSSRKYGGPGAIAEPHVPLGVVAPIVRARLTEGILKADVAFALSDLPTVGVAGVGSWRRAITALQSLKCRTVLLSFDRDALVNPVVAGAMRSCADALKCSGFRVQIEKWNPFPERKCF
jgi:hypothetical protein